MNWRSAQYRGGVLIRFELSPDYGVAIDANALVAEEWKSIRATLAFLVDNFRRSQMTPLTVHSPPIVLVPSHHQPRPFG
jgi:hypothetical protein